jgi:hypothetical protein
MGSFNFEIAPQCLNRVVRQRKNSLSVSFAPDTELAFGKTKLFEAEFHNLAGAQAVEQHQGSEADIPIGAEA